MDLSSIGAASIDMHMGQTMEAVGISLLKKAMDTQETQAANLINSMQAQPAPSFGHLLDTYA